MSVQPLRVIRSLIVAAVLSIMTACNSPSAPTVVGARWIWRDNCPGAYPAQESSPYVIFDDDPALFGFSKMKNRTLTVFAGYGLR